MKKMLILEIIAFAALLVLALVLCLQPAKETFAPQDPVTDVTLQTSSPSTAATVPAPTWMTLPATRQLTCQQYFVYDCNAEAFTDLFGTQDQRVYPASITKLFTAYVALQYLPADTVITAGNELDQVVWGSSVAGLEFGDALTVEQLVEAMLLPSGNDAAYVLAAAAGRMILQEPEADAVYAVEAFMEEMNGRADTLGMTGSHFVNPDGIHDDSHYMTYADLALLGKLSLQTPTICKYAALAEGNNPRYVPGLDEEDENAPKQWKNTNALIHEDNEYYCPYAVGLKTGQTPMAGSCLLSAFTYEGRSYIIGVFGCPEIEDRFTDTLQLFNQAIGIS